MPGREIGVLDVVFLVANELPHSTWTNCLVEVGLSRFFACASTSLHTPTNQHKFGSAEALGFSDGRVLVGVE